MALPKTVTATIKVVGILAAAFLVLAAAAFVARYRQKPIVKKVAMPGRVVTFSTDTPSEIAPDKKTYVWQGSASEPKYITLPSIGTEGYIQKVGQDQRQQVAVPSNIHVAGWFVQSVAPGDVGLSIIDGHVDGLHDPGIFKNLQKLKKDDVFMLTLGSGTLLTYKVLSTANVQQTQAANILFSQSPQVKSQLNLITCGGTFDRQSKQYLNRIIISAALL